MAKRTFPAEAEPMFPESVVAPSVQLATGLVDHFALFIPHIRSYLQQLIATGNPDQDEVSTQLESLLRLTPYGILGEEFVMLLEYFKKMDPVRAFDYWQRYAGEEEGTLSWQVKLNRQK